MGHRPRGCKEPDMTERLTLSLYNVENKEGNTQHGHVYEMSHPVARITMLQKKLKESSLLSQDPADWES